MQIQVLYFAVFRERLGRDTEPLEVPDGATVADAVAALAARHPLVGTLRGHFRVAVNQAMVDDAHVLVAGDELVLIPPVAGGNDRVHVAILDAPLSLDRCLAAFEKACDDQRYVAVCAAYAKHGAFSVGATLNILLDVLDY